MSKVFTIFALSDATGGLAYNLAQAAAKQFPEHEPEIVKAPMISRVAQIDEFVEKARVCHGVLFFTFVKAEMRHAILERAREQEVVAIDVMGPSLDALSYYFHLLPSDEPGLQYGQAQEYFKRTEALEFTVRHDDGLALDTIGAADVVFLGISRTSKTPLAIFLAYKGYCCANVPVIKDMPLPEQVLAMDHKKFVGLTIDVKKLSVIRSTRLSKLGRSQDELYSDLSQIYAEVDYAQHLYHQLRIPVIDISGKAIEEIANEVNQLMGLS